MSHPALDEYRERYFTVGAVLEAFERSNRLLISDPPGVGKTRLIDTVLVSPELRERYDLVMYAGGTRELNAERAEHLARNEVKYIDLTARPAEDCGPLDGQWKRAEESGRSHFARKELCEERCPTVTRCRWPKQFKPIRFPGCRTIIFPQDYLKLIPGVVDLLAEWARARRPLLVIDESPLLEEVQVGHVRIEEAESLARAARAARLDHVSDVAERLAACLASNPDAALREHFAMPLLRTREHIALQEAGVDLFGESYRNRYFPVRSLADAGPDRRWWHRNAARYSAMPRFSDGTDVLLTAADVSLELLRAVTGDARWERHGDGRTLMHPGTRIVNVNTSASSAAHFLKNSPQILDLAVQWCIREVRAGGSGLIICRQRFVPDVIKSMNLMFERAGWGGLRAVEGKDYQPGTGQIPVVHYPAVGSNRFEHCTLAICVSALNLPEKAYMGFLNSARAPAEASEVRMRMARYREAFVPNDGGPRALDDAKLIGPIQLHMEARTISQTVGRVRPWTHPRTIVLCHRGPLTLQVDREYTSWRELREAEGFTRQRTRSHADREEEAQRLHGEGRTNAEIASQLDVSERSVRRYLQTG